MKNWNSAFFILPSALESWLPDMDLNHDKQIQSLLCYRYTIGQAGASGRLKGFTGQSSRQTAVPEGREKGLSAGLVSSPAGTKENRLTLSPLRGLAGFGTQIQQLKPWATLVRPAGALN
jgi:hypothetical protein